MGISHHRLRLLKDGHELSDGSFQAGRASWARRQLSNNHQGYWDGNSNDPNLCLLVFRFLVSQIETFGG